MPKRRNPKKTPDPHLTRIESAKFLLDSGLLFEINRRVLHPLGLALEVVVEDDGTAKLGQLWDCRTDPEGILYTDEAFAEGYAKLLEYLGTTGLANIKSRYEKLGFLVQGGQDPLVPELD
jgi:hypothetical protein